MKVEKQLIPILSITGSDGTGGSGIQADIKTCGVLGGYALSVTTAITIQDTLGIKSTHALPTDIILAQLESIVRDMPPKAVKIGMICSTETLREVLPIIQDIKHIVLDTAFISSRGEKITSNNVICEICNEIMPISDISIIKLQEAEMLIGESIKSREQMLLAAKTISNTYGTAAIIIQGTHNGDEMRNDLFVKQFPKQTTTFYTLPDYSNCNTHGLAGTLSTSIATFLAKGFDLEESVQHAYEYIKSLTVFSIDSPLGHKSSLLSHGIKDGKNVTPRQKEIYNSFIELITNNCAKQHDVRFYAESLNITARYLSQITMHVTRKTPHQLIAEELANEASNLLNTTTRSIQEISYALGFSNQSQFYRLFKKTKGVAPTLLRK